MYLSLFTSMLNNKMIRNSIFMLPFYSLMLTFDLYFIFLVKNVPILILKSCAEIPIIFNVLLRISLFSSSLFVTNATQTDLGRSKPIYFLLNYSKLAKDDIICRKEKIVPYIVAHIFK